MPILNEKDLIQVEKVNSFIRNYRVAVASQDSAWFKIKSNWRHERVYLNDENGNVIAAMTILFQHLALGHHFAYSPRGPVCDFNDKATVMKLIEEAKPLFKKYKVFALRLDPEIANNEALLNKYKQLGFKLNNNGFSIRPRYNFKINIKDRQWDELKMDFSQKCRYNIKLAFQKGVTVRFGNSEKDIETFYEIYRSTASRDGFVPRSIDYFKRFFEAFDEQSIRIYVAEYEQTPLAAAIALCYGGKLWYVYGASGNEKREFMPTHAMHSEMIKWGIEKQCWEYDFGGVFALNKENGLYRFKEAFCRKDGISEYIGELDYVLNGLWYFAFAKGLPLYEKVKFALHKH